jgi:hypothetical protein
VWFFWGRRGGLRAFWRRVKKKSRVVVVEDVAVLRALVSVALVVGVV